MSDKTKQKEQKLYFPAKLLKDWDNMHQAYKLLEEGKGRIVERKTKGRFVRFVEVKENDD